MSTLCKLPQILPNATLVEHALRENTQTFAASGCKNCNHVYLGRTAIFEILPITGAISELIMQRCDIGEIEKYLSSIQHQTLRQAALNKINLGITSPEEVNRVIT